MCLNTLLTCNWYINLAYIFIVLNGDFLLFIIYLVTRYNSNHKLSLQYEPISPPPPPKDRVTKVPLKKGVFAQPKSMKEGV